MARPFLRPPNVFRIIDGRDPDRWIHAVGAEGERDAEPATVNGAGFPEDCCDGNTRVARPCSGFAHGQLTCATNRVPFATTRRLV